ncbi:hypothetical protein VNI00_012309 [Paramarasmius palmivorus]|uniref:DUF6534 domain-containing protein n=1 Tax=Paramarasmius palmivorus TaxID=297713 RepID=A0AAW0C8F0_9AGAR
MADQLQTPPAFITGPLMLGYMLSWGLLGILSVQIYLYYTAFPKDPLKFKVLVYFIYILDVVQTIMFTHDAFERFVYGFGNPLAVISPNLLWFSSPFIDGLVGLLVQLQYTYRIFKLSPETKWVLAPILLASLTQFGCALGSTIIAGTASTIEELGENNFVIGVVWLISSAVADVLIALSMIYALNRYDRSFEQTNDIVKKIIRLTVETGTITACVAICHAALILAMPQKNYHVLPAMILAKLYSNSLMVMFNSRIRMAGRDHNEINSSVKSGDMALSSLQAARRQTAIRTHIETNTWRDEPRDNYRSRHSMDSDGLNTIGVADNKHTALP